MWDEVHYHQIESSYQLRQVTYDTDEESLEILEVSEESRTLCSTSLQSIKYNIHIIGKQQSFSFDVEVEEDDEILEHVVNEKPFPEMVEEIILDMESSLTPDLQPPSSIELKIADEEKEVDKHMRVVTLSFQVNLLSKCIPAHQLDDFHTVFIPLNQNTLAWKENYTAIYDEPDSSSDHEQGEELLYQESPKYSQVEEKVVLNEAYISNPLDQVLFQDPFVVFLEKSEGVVGSIMNKLLPIMRKNLSTTV